MKMFKQILVFILMLFTLAGCGSGDGNASTAATEELVLLEVVTLTSDTETAIEARPEIFFYNDRFFFVYLYAPTAGTREHRVRIYDAGLSTVGDYLVSATTTLYGSPTDIRGTQVGGQVYLAYETLIAPPDADKETFVLLTVHNLDESFSRTAPTESGSVLLASEVGEGLGNEVLADPTVYVKDGALVLLTDIVNGPTGDAIHYLREYDASDLTTIIEPGREINLGTTVGIMGMGGVSALFNNNGTTTGIFRHMVNTTDTWEFKLVAFDDYFEPITDSVKTIADQGLNLQPTGILAMNNGYLLAHSNNDTTVPSSGEEDREIWLKLFNQDFDLLQATKLDDYGIHPTLATDGDKLYLAYSSGGKLKVAIFSVAQI